MTRRKRTEEQNAEGRPARIGDAQVQKAIQVLRALIAELREDERLDESGSRKTTAAEAYADLAVDIARLMDVLQMEVARHIDATKQVPVGWVRVGELGRVRSELIDIVALLRGLERDDVIEFLDDATADR